MIGAPLFEFKAPTHLYFGNQVIRRLPQGLAALALNNVLVVTDRGIVESGLLEIVLEQLHRASRVYDVFDAVEPNPSIDTVRRGAALFREKTCDGIVAVGGGSAMDAAKAIGVLATHEGNITDYTRQGGKPVQPSVPAIVAIPTTAGTGSEVTWVSVLSDPAKRMKVVIPSPYIAPKIALADPAMTRTLPPEVTAATGMDALTHAIEAYVSLKSTPISDTLALKAVFLIGASLRKAVANGDNMEARSNMMLGSTMAGLAFINSSTGLTHSMAHALWGAFDMPHGMGNAVMLPVVMRYNQSAAPEKYRDIAAALGEPVAGLSVREAGERGVAAVERLLVDIGIAIDLGKLGVEPHVIDQMAEHAMAQTGSFPFNPRRLSRTDLVNLFKAAFGLSSG
jgi:alcohol dehydrogenase class IV